MPSTVLRSIPQKLRGILNRTYSVTLRSDQKLISDVNSMIAQRVAECQRRNVPPPPFKSGLTTIPSFNGRWTFRPLQLLHKIGRVTTPPSANMARWSAMWAIWRYFWAFEPVATGADFRLNRDARRLDPHQKGV